MSYKVCLVLGAGASVAMGYPVGSELRSNILEHSTGKYEEFICSNSLGIFSDQVEEFVKVFRASQMLSIDAFLARRQEFAEIGKRAISAILLDRENKDLLHSCEHNDHWYSYFFNKIAAAHDWDGLNFNEVAIITFNYDRSFEHYMVNALMHSYGKSFIEAHKKLDSMKIVHIYGELGSSNPMDSDYFPYGSAISQKYISVASSRLKVIPEGRKEDRFVRESKEALLNSKRIAFLGFGFDERNLELLNSKETCQDKIYFNNSNLLRKVVGTCLGMTNAEALKALNATAKGSGMILGINVNDYFHDKNCLNMLKETLILD